MELLEEAQPRLTCIARRAGLDRADAEDCLQEVLLELVRRHDEVRRPKAWLVRVFRNEVSSLLRRRIMAREDPLEWSPEPEISVSRYSADPLARLMACEALAGASARHRRVLWLRFGKGLGWREIAAELGVRPSGAKKSIVRALAAARAAMADLAPRGAARRMRRPERGS